MTPAVRDPSTLVLSYHVRLTLGLSAASNVMSGNCFFGFFLLNKLTNNWLNHDIPDLQLWHLSAHLAISEVISKL